tara:strand:+ start:6701 stop:7996 length:1296 start_codon:yes stop_codon:yes gene_type:complete
MAKSFKGSNRLVNARGIFNEKTIYNTDNLLIDYSERYANFVFFNLYEFQLYGRVARLPAPIILRPKALTGPSLKSLESRSESQIRLVNFVADAFADFKAAFRKKQYKGELATNETFLSNIVPYKGHISADAEYAKHRQNIFNAINQHVFDKNLQIKNFQDFMRTVEGLFYQFADKIPVTRSGFIKSRFCSPLVSGLVVEISSLNYDDDQRKFDAFISSPNFEFYLNNAREHGFYVDASAPWRMIADLGSTQMERYMENYDVRPAVNSDLEHVDIVLTSYYDIAAPDGFELLITTLVGMYNSFVGLNPYDTEPFMCSNGETMIRGITRKEITIQYATKLYSTHYWLWLYLRLRNIESNSILNEENLHILYNNLSKMVDKLPIRDILWMMEIAICDVSGESGSYHNFAKGLTQEEQYKLNMAIYRGARDISSY